MPTNPLSSLASSHVESHDRHFLVGMESGSDILCCRAHILGSVTNMFRGLFKDRLASLKASSFLPRWAIVCLLLFWVFLAVLVLLDLLLMIITANVDRGQWNQIRPESTTCAIFPYPRALEGFPLTISSLEIKMLRIVKLLV